MRALRFASNFVAVGVASGISLGLAVAPAKAQDSFNDGFEPTFFPSTWTGFYAGVNAGGHWSDKDSIRISSPTAGFATSADTDRNGFIGGGQIGYNWQTGNVVVGLETDIQGVDASHTFSGVIGGSTWATRSKLQWLGTVRGRAGVMPNANTLLYATGGFAYGGVELQAASAAFGAAPKSSQTATGWTFGGGAEFALSSNTFLRGEYLYYDLGSEKVTLTSGAATATAKADYAGHITRLGLSFKF